MSDTDKHCVALDRVLELVVVLNEDMKRSLAARGLTVSRTHLLWVLAHGDPITQKSLADALRVSPRTITGLVDGLVATGFVTREPHPFDRRAILVTLTDAGKDVMSDFERDHEQLARALFADMDDGDFDGFVAGLDVLLVRLREGLSGSSGL